MQHFPLQSEFSEIPLFGVFSHFCTGGGIARLKIMSPRMRAPCRHHARTSQPQAPQARQETSPEDPQSIPEGAQSVPKQKRPPKRAEAEAPAKACPSRSAKACPSKGRGATQPTQESKGAKMKKPMKTSQESGGFPEEMTPVSSMKFTWQAIGKSMRKR